MTSTYLNLITFLLTTLFYYLVLKPSVKLEDIKSNTPPNHTSLAIYFLLVVVVQFIINTSIITNTCGGNITDNIGFSGLVTFLPWTFIFGIIMVVLLIYPNFKNIFANVIGYFTISSSANKLLTELLINKDIQKKIDGDTTASPDEKVKMQEAADTIIKICGNTSVLINQITPDNFLEYWGLLKPLMKQQYQTMSEETTGKQQKLFELVVTKDNIGEVLWYIYTGILLTSLVQLKITTRGCVNNIKTMQANYQDYLTKEKEATDKKQQAESTVYTISS